MEPDLLPCPFCGGMAHYMAFASADYGADGVIVKCGSCGASTRYCADIMIAEAVAHGRQLAADAWNQRKMAAKDGFSADSRP